MENKQAIAQECHKICSAILKNMNEVVVGKQAEAKKMLICLIAGGHILIEDVPGIGKTTIVNALAKSVSLDFQRIQFTPDLMPSDVTGFNLYNPKLGEFIFQEGAINTQILLADEINRSSPRTQSALLEAMQEGQVTVEGTTYQLPQPFMVLATQNPVEHVGTYPLPEAQMDRFMMKISLGYPSFEEEMRIVDIYAIQKNAKEIRTVADAKEILWMKEQVSQIFVSEEVKKYLLDICRKTRQHEMVELGVSPRASQMLLSACRALALLNGRSFVTPDDVQEISHDVLDHRLILKPQARGRGIDAIQVVEDVLKSVVAPK